MNHPARALQALGGDQQARASVTLDEPKTRALQALQRVPSLQSPPQSAPQDASQLDATSPSIQVLALLTHQPILRIGLQACLAQAADFKWLDVDVDVDGTLNSAAHAAPDVVLIDADSASAACLIALDTCEKWQPLVRLVLLQGLPAERSALGRRLVERAAWVLDKSASPQALMHAIRSVHRGGRMTPVASRPELAAATKPSGLGHDLTRRERDLLRCMAQGLSNQDLAARLGIRLPTVKYHVTHILAKLNASNRTTAVLLALRHGLVEPTCG